MSTGKHVPGKILYLTSEFIWIPHLPAGFMQQAPRKKAISKKWAETTASKAIAYFIDKEELDQMDEADTFSHCLQLIAINGDAMKPGQFVIAQKSNVSFC